MREGMGSGVRRYGRGGGETRVVGRWGDGWDGYGGDVCGISGGRNGVGVAGYGEVDTEEVEVEKVPWSA